jgi:hypothetical protein
MLQIFTALKNPSPLPGLNTRTLGPTASALTITPPRQLVKTLKETTENSHGLDMQNERYPKKARQARQRGRTSTQNQGDSILQNILRENKIGRIKAKTHTKAGNSV